MESKFKVGDRVRHHVHGNGTVMDAQEGYEGIYCDFGYWCDESNLELIDNSPTEPMKYDRAMIAAMAMQGELSGQSAYINWANEIELAKRAVLVADALLAELEKPRQ